MALKEFCSWRIEWSSRFFGRRKPCSNSWSWIVVNDLWRISSCSPFNLMTFSVADGSPLANRSRTFSNILSKSVILHYYFLSKSNRNKLMTASYARMGISHQFIDSSAAHKRLHRHLTSSCDSDKELLFVLSA